MRRPSPSTTAIETWCRRSGQEPEEGRAADPTFANLVGVLNRLGRRTYPGNDDRLLVVSVLLWAGSTPAAVVPAVVRCRAFVDEQFQSESQSDEPDWINGVEARLACK